MIIIRLIIIVIIIFIIIRIIIALIIIIARVIVIVVTIVLTATARAAYVKPWPYPPIFGDYLPMEPDSLQETFQHAMHPPPRPRKSPTSPAMTSFRRPGAYA